MTSQHRYLKPLVIASTAIAIALSFSCSTMKRQASARNVRDVNYANKSGFRQSRDLQRSSITGSVAQPNSQRSSLIIPIDGSAPVKIISKSQSRPNTTVAASNGDLMSTGKVLEALVVPSQPGFVRSPYTQPARLIVVKEATPGSTMICPYTHKPFIVPTGFVNAPAPKPRTDNIVSTQPRSTTPVESSTLTPAVASNRQSSISSGSEFGSVFPSSDAAKTSPLKSNFANAPVNITPPTEGAAMQEAPYGELIPGRPGFVNSPYAAKNQLVDVTGLPVGMEVKCPYSGKLFRVPSAEMASSKATAPSTTPEQPARN
ncbi:MAG: hypothetical protein ACOYMN_20450 [Roseimicrobium sp.]